MQSRFSFAHTFPPVTLNLLIINMLLWLAQLVLPQLTNIAGMHYFQAEDFRIWQLLSYAFLHSPSGFSHIFFNMFALFMFGGHIERLFGSRRFLVYYLVCAFSAAVSQQLVWAYSLYPLASSGQEFVLMPSGNLEPVSYLLNLPLTIGASGAVFGVLLAFGWFYPNAPIFLMFIPFPIRAKYFVIFYGLLELWQGVQGAGDGVAHFAHLGGMVGGLILILIWRRRARERQNANRFNNEGYR